MIIEDKTPYVQNKNLRQSGKFYSTAGSDEGDILKNWEKAGREKEVIAREQASWWQIERQTNNCDTKYIFYLNIFSR